MALYGLPGFLVFMLQGIRTTVATIALIPFRIQFLAVWLLMVLFLLINAGSFYSDPSSQQTLLLIYISSLAFVFALSRTTNPLAGITTAEFLLTYSLWLVIGATLLKTIGIAPTQAAVLTSAGIATLLTHAFAVAIGEELLFRVAIPGMLSPFGPVGAQGVSAIAFGLFHWTAYGGDLMSIGFATLLGFFFGMIVVRWPRLGLIAAMGLHTAYNLVLLGYV